MIQKLAFLFALLISTCAHLQELNCQVTVVSNAKLEVTTVETEIFDVLKQTVYDMMNNTKWTKDQFKVEERINCQLQIQIDEIPASGSYSGSMQIQSTRPAYNSSYNTTLFNFQDDDVQFTFSRNALLAYAPNQFRDNLTSMLAFYAYYIIGMDYDSFSSKGGTAYFVEAQQIVNNAQSSPAKGWKSNEIGKRNRYWLIDNALHQLFEPLRECNFLYHRKGIDHLYDDEVAARAELYQALTKLQKVAATRPNSVNLLNFLQAKTNEIKSLYSAAQQKDKTDIVNLLKKLDPANATKYEQILA